MNKRALLMNEKDNVVTVIDAVQSGDQTIGRATCAIRRGEYVHVHNIESVKTND